MQRQLYHLQQLFPFKQDSNIIQAVTVSSIQILGILSDSGKMLAQFDRKVVYLSDNATQTQIKMTENIVEIKKILKKWFMDC